jgi:benzylsuccinate CoA-transferase BbsF subunit
MGAEVIRIESMRKLCESRTTHGLSIPTLAGTNEGQIFHQLNANKLSVTLNLSQPKAIELAKRIVSLSDVVIENMRPGVLERLGLGYEVLQQARPDIVMLSSSARGATGPERQYAGFAPQQAAVAGMSHLAGYADGEPTQLHSTPDLTNGNMAAFAILAALHYRWRTGEGQYIDLSQVDGLSTFIGEAILDYTMNGRIRSRSGNHDDLMAPHNCYRCRGEDKWVSIAIGTEEEWQAFCQAIGSPDWARDERFSDADSRWQNQDVLDKLITEWTMNRSHLEVMGILQEKGVAAVPSFSSDELFEGPHLRERGWFVKVAHPEVGQSTVLGPPWKLSLTPATVRRHAPLLGEHNQYVFGRLLGMPEEEIQKLVEERVIY